MRCARVAGWQCWPKVFLLIVALTDEIAWNECKSGKDASKTRSFQLLIPPTVRCTKKKRSWKQSYNQMFVSILVQDCHLVKVSAVIAWSICPASTQVLTFRKKIFFLSLLFLKTFGVNTVSSFPSSPFLYTTWQVLDPLWNSETHLVPKKPPAFPGMCGREGILPGFDYIAGRVWASYVVQGRGCQCC